jgi:acyl-CoA synthetase (AMP-forming)/AMP-acid ligase II
MSPPRIASLWDSFCDTAHAASGRLRAAETEVALADLASGTALGVALEELRGRTILIATSNPLAAALALIEVDGIARRLVLCPPDFDPLHLPYVAETAEVDVIVTDCPDSLAGTSNIARARCAASIHPTPVNRTSEYDTEWILFTSGTTGVPKMVVHTRETLTGAIARSGALAGPVTWATFYDIRRYGGLQILLRAVVGGGSLVLASPS